MYPSAFTRTWLVRIIPSSWGIGFEEHIEFIELVFNRAAALFEHIGTVVIQKSMFCQDVWVMLKTHTRALPLPPGSDTLQLCWYSDCLMPNRHGSHPGIPTIEAPPHRGAFLGSRYAMALGISGERTMSTMSLFDVSLIRAGVSDQAVTCQVQSLLKSRTFLDTLVFEHLAPTSRSTRVDTVLMLANGCECSPRTLGEHFATALKWFDCAVTQALLQLEKVPARTHERGLN